MTQPPYDFSTAGRDGTEFALAAFRSAVLGSEELDETELSAVSGVPLATIRRLWRAMGHVDAQPGARPFTHADVTALREVAAVLAARGEETVIEDARILSSLLARAASVIGRRLSGEIESLLLADAAEADPASAVRTRLLAVSALLDYVFRRQLFTELTRVLTATASSTTRPAEQRAAVIFADLVGFTAVSEALDDDELEALVARFQSVAFDLVARLGGRVVKTLGDEVMVVCDDVEVALAVATSLASSYADEALLPEVRVGMAYGAVLAAQGDFFGPTVNLASRLVAVAPPGAVVLSQEAHDALGAESRRGLTQFGPRRLKGIGWTVSWVVAPAGRDHAAPADAALEEFYAALLDDDAEELYDRAPCGYLSTTPDGTIIKVNQTFLTWTGHQRTDLVGRRRFVDLLSVGGRIYHETHYAPMLHTQGMVREIAMDILGRDGARTPALVNAVLERDEAGAPIVIRVAIFDATERREYERELVRARHLAEQSEARARLLAHTLQTSLIPPALPRIPHLALAAAYRPAGSGDEVGGDFYDVFEVGTGDWFVVVGDVCGKGAEAAVVTALARYTIRAAAARLTSPRAVLEFLNDALLRHGGDRFCTIAAARLHEVSAGWSVTLCAAGHPLPLKIGSDSRPAPIGEHGALLGVFDAPALEDCEVLVRPEERLVFYTDGVTEGRRAADFYGDDRLKAAVARTETAQATVNALVSDVMQFQGGMPADDVAIVVVQAVTADAP